MALRSFFEEKTVRHLDLNISQTIALLPEVYDSPNPEAKQLPAVFPTPMLATYPSIESGLRQPPWAAKEEPRVNRAQYRPPEYEKDDMLRLI